MGSLDPRGTLAAWHGLERLRYCYFDLLLPSHGVIVEQQPRACVAQTQKKLLQLIRAKGSICAGEKNRWLDLEPMASTGASRVLLHLYHFGANSFLLVGKNGAGMVVDPTLGSIHQLEPLMREIGLERIEVTTASHYHLDHSDALNQVAPTIMPPSGCTPGWPRLFATATATTCPGYPPNPSSRTDCCPKPGYSAGARIALKSAPSPARPGGTAPLIR